MANPIEMEDNWGYPHLQKPPNWSTISCYFEPSTSCSPPPAEAVEIPSTPAPCWVPLMRGLVGFLGVNGSTVNIFRSSFSSSTTVQNTKNHHSLETSSINDIQWEFDIKCYSLDPACHRKLRSLRDILYETCWSNPYFWETKPKFDDPKPLNIYSTPLRLLVKTMDICSKFYIVFIIYCKSIMIQSWTPLKDSV